VVVSVTGCQSAGHSIARNCNFFVDDTIRFLGLDRPSLLHPRDLEPLDLYEPYRGYP
jgi:hypothetical protein